MAFVQFYVVLGIQDHRNEKIDEQVDCLRLQQQRSVAESNGLKSEKVLGILPTDTMRALIHIVCPKEISGHFSSQNERRQAERAR